MKSEPLSHRAWLEYSAQKEFCITSLVLTWKPVNINQNGNEESKALPVCGAFSMFIANAHYEKIMRNFKVFAPK